MRPTHAACGFVLLALTQAQAQAPLPEAIAAPGRVVATLHAQGAQVYECRAGTDGRTTWQFREPIATLMEGGRTVGRHYAGPNWELADGSRIIGRVTGRAPGATPADIPWLRLEVTERAGAGRLTPAATVLRINTAGGVAEGPCPTAGAFLSVAYATDYVVLAPAN
jgi:hypothetical protein